MAEARPRAKKGPHGGARGGAGRKRTRDVDPGRVRAAEDKIRDKLPELVDNLLRLARGGYELGEEEWGPYEPPDGDDDEAPPGADPDPGPPPLVLKKRRVSIAEPDREANKYLLDRILGRPRDRLDADLTVNGVFKTILYLPENGRDATDGDGVQPEGGPP